MCILCDVFNQAESLSVDEAVDRIIENNNPTSFFRYLKNHFMTRKEELTAERESLSRTIESFEDSIAVAKQRIKFTSKRLKLVEEEISELLPPEPVTDGNKANEATLGEEDKTGNEV